MGSRKWIKTIEILGDRVVRVACLPPGQKRVIPSFAVREPLDFKPARCRAANGWRTARAGAVTVSVRDCGRPFGRDNLMVRWTHEGRERLWRPGDVDEDNLGGPYQALDLLCETVIGPDGARRPYDPMQGFNSYSMQTGRLYDICRLAVEPHLGPGEPPDAWGADLWRMLEGRPPVHMKAWPRSVIEAVRQVSLRPPGMLSRWGLTIIRDDSLPWDASADWPAPRPEAEQQILYLIHYGLDFKAGVRAMRDLFGPPPRVPDWVLGVWFSCYRVMGEREFRKVAGEFERRGLPLDAVVVDTDWHRHFWHGFDWNTELFPAPERFRDWLRHTGLHAVFNVHPLFIPEGDSRLAEFLAQSGAEKHILGRTQAPHPFMAGCQHVALFDRRQAEAYFDVFHRPIEQEGGCEVWWVDGTLADNKGHDATSFMNECYAVRARFAARAVEALPSSSARTSPAEKRSRTRSGISKRSNAAGPATRFVLSRGHGLGAHRSLLHFTGDTLSQWAVLREEVRLTPLAANALIAFTSHDIGGFMKGAADWKQNKPPADLMVRWVQFGVFSPVFRLHSDHGVREPWRFGRRAGAIMGRFLRLRRAMRPYLKRCARQACETGLALVRPMYFEFPEHHEAYEFPLQYMLGSDVLVAPVTSPEGVNSCWIPPGVWRHLFDNRALSGPLLLNESVPLEVMPVFIRQGGGWDRWRRWLRRACSS
ncbi:MAG: hypothetical protein Kow0059_08740 [Candidatus Sumerlaeia bacterium]